MSDDVMFDGIEFPGVETPPKQLPGAWRLLRIGANPLTKEGKPFELRISREDVLAMADFAREKGGKIPIDSRHALFAGEGNSNPLQYSCLENSMDGGAWRATIHGVVKSRTRLND